MKQLLMVLAMVCCGGCAGPVGSSPWYTVTDLGPGCANSINSVGQVVGGDSLKGGRAFLWSDGKRIDLGTLGGPTSCAFDINDAGDVVGFSAMADGKLHATLYRDGEMIDLGLGSASTINNAGQIFGSNGAGRACLWRDGEVTELGVPGQATYVNHAGQVVGYTQPYRAFLYSHGEATDLGTMGRTFALAYGINDAGHIVGEAAGHAFLYRDGAATDLGTLGGSKSVATSINNTGQIVGYLDTSAGRRAFLYDGQKMTDLNCLIDTGSGWTLTYAQRINDSGQIVGYGTYRGQVRAFLLSPPSGRQR